MKITLPKITPGPWHECGVNPDSFPMVRAADGHVVADCSRILKRSRFEQGANNKACSQVPAMLEALAFVYERLKKSGYPDGPNLQTLKAALLAAGCTISE